MMIAALILIACARKRLQNLRDIDKVSLNILNLWLFRFMIIGLSFTFLQNLYLSVAINIVANDRKEAVPYDQRNFLSRNVWFSVTIMAGVQWAQNICNCCKAVNCISRPLRK